MSRWVGMVVSVAFVATAWSDAPKKPDSVQEAMKKMEKHATPGAEHKKLEPLVGMWNYTCKVWMDPSKPPMEMKGTIERKWILGNRFIEEKVSGTGMDGKPGFEGIGVVGYDNGEKKFTMSWICNMCTSIATSAGTCDVSGKTFTFENEAYCPVREKKIKGREVLRMESNDRHVMERFEIENGKERKVMEIIAIRTK